jgi:hypothetical protein
MYSGVDPWLNESNMLATDTTQLISLNPVMREIQSITNQVMSVLAVLSTFQNKSN